MANNEPRPGYHLARDAGNAGQTLFVPGHFTFRDEAAMLALVAGYPLAQLFTAEAGEHRVTAAPMVALPERDAAGRLVLVGHIARRNPQAAPIAAGATATAVFNGPGAYVSPRWFRVTHTAPTWNYRAVQAHGRVELIDDAPGVEDVLRRTVAQVERGAHPGTATPPWTLDDLPPERADVLLGMVAAFRLVVTRLEGIDRLNQDKHLDDILSIMAALGRSPQPQARAVAGAMAERLAVELPFKSRD